MSASRSIQILENESRTNIAVYTELQVLCKGQPLDAGYIADAEEPDVSQNFSFPHIAGDDATEDVDLNLHVAGGIHPGKLVSTVSERYS